MPYYEFDKDKDGKGGVGVVAAFVNVMNPPGPSDPNYVPPDRENGQDGGLTSVSMTTEEEREPNENENDGSAGGGEPPDEDPPEPDGYDSPGEFSDPDAGEGGGAGVPGTGMSPPPPAATRADVERARAAGVRSLRAAAERVRSGDEEALAAVREAFGREPTDLLLGLVAGAMDLAADWLESASIGVGIGSGADIRLLTGPLSASEGASLTPGERAAAAAVTTGVTERDGTFFFERTATAPGPDGRYVVLGPSWGTRPGANVPSFERQVGQLVHETFHAFTESSLFDHGSGHPVFDTNRFEDLVEELAPYQDEPGGAHEDGALEAPHEDFERDPWGGREPPW